MTSRVPEPSPAPASGDAGVRARRAVRDIRLVMLLNVATIPLSLATNLVLGRTSAEALGWYGAVQIFVAAFNTFVIIGGAPVFSRLVPGMAREDRAPFLIGYFTLILGFLTALTAVGLLAPSALRSALGRFGEPHWGMAYAVCVAVLVMSFATHFLYAVERAPRAAAALKSVIVGYFVAALVAATIGADAFRRDPAGFMWRSTLIIYTIAAALGVIWVLVTPEVRQRFRPRPYLPAGFWPVALYTHVGTIVEFAFSQMYPAFVLVWLDVAALGRLHAAMRFVSLLALVPVMLTSVLAPGLARLEAGGLREEALRQAAAALRGCVALLAPCVFALIVFAPSAMALFGRDFTPYATVLRLVAPMALAGPVVYLGGGMAVAFGAFRSYLWVSLVFVVTSVLLALFAIPRWGLVGAAGAATLGTLVQQIAMSLVMRLRIGFRVPFRSNAAWIVAVGTWLTATIAEPGPLAGLGVWAVACASFAWLGAVSIGEVRALSARALGRG